MFDRKPGGEYTNAEIKAKYLRHIAHMCRYWEHESRAPTNREKLEGLAFSILSMLDGCTILPGVTMIARGTEEDMEFHQENGSRWYPVVGEELMDTPHDFGGALHEQINQYFEEMK